VVVIGPGIPGFSVHCGPGNIVHLSGCHVVQLKVRGETSLSQRAMHDHPITSEQGVRGALDRTVGVDLDEQPLRSPLDVDALIDPGVHTGQVRRIIAGERAVFDPDRQPLPR
jgi:hypothetical protein